MKALVTALLVGCLSIAIAGPAHASCAPPPGMRVAIRGSAAAFVGTVVELANQDRWATVDVIEVWNGDDLPARVEVRAGPKDPPGRATVVTSVDRSYALGETYLFVPYERNGPVFRDNACTATSRFTPRIERFRPPSVSPSPSGPLTPEPTGEDPVEASDGGLSDDALPDEGLSDERLSDFALILGALLIAALAVGGAWLKRRP